MTEKNRISKLILFFLLISCSFPSSGSAQGIDPFQWSTDQSAKTLVAGQAIPLSITFTIPAKYYLYKDKMGLILVGAPEGLRLSPLEFSPPTTKKDPFTGRDEEIFEEAAEMKTQLLVSKDVRSLPQKITLQLTYQGCSDKLCYRFNEKKIEIPIHATSTQVSGVPFQNRGFLVMLLLTFLGGIGSAFTPCVLPIIPITLAFIGVRKQGESLAKNFLLYFLLVLSMSLTYAVLGSLAAVLGKSLGFLFQSPYFLGFGVVLFIVFSLSMFGLFELQVPLALRNRMAKLGGAGVAGSILSGFTVGFLAAPCVGPLIGSLLLYVAKGQNLAKGFTLLFVYGLGMGLIFLVIGTYYHQLAAKVHGGPYMIWIKRVFAIILLIPAFYYGSIVIHHFYHAPSAEESRFWITNVDEGLAKAGREHKPVFMDFFASWCFPCVEMQKGTFSNAELQRFMTEKMVPIKVDCTEETPQCKKMVDRYGVVGWPTFLILQPNGEIITSLVGQSLSPEQLKEELMKFVR